MTNTPSVFDDGTGVHQTHWQIVRNGGGAWRAPDGEGDPNIAISPNDPAWDRVRAAARTQYGDPNIDYIDDGRSRHLAFGDRKQLPTDGTLVYHDPQGRNWIPYSNGTYAPADDNFHPNGTPFSPAGYELINGHHAPINSHGDQIGPQGDLPHPTGWHVHDNIWTPENKNGDYYEITDPKTGARNYFNKEGHPITQQQYDSGSATPAGQTPDDSAADDGGHGPNDDTTVLTDEQNSGAAATAAKTLESKLQDRNNKTVDADRQLAEVLLNAHATTADGAKRLNDIQKEVEAAVNAQPALDTPMGKREFQKFINGKLKEVGDIIRSASLDAKSQKDTAAALADAINTRPDINDGSAPAGGNADPGNQQQQQQPGSGPPPPIGTSGGDVGDLGGELADAGLGDPGGLAGAIPLTSALGGLSSIPGAAAGIPAALGGLGTSIPSGIGSMLGGGGLGNLGGGLFDQPHSEHHHKDELGDDSDIAGALGDSSLDPPKDSDHSDDNSNQQHSNNHSDQPNNGAQQPAPLGTAASALAPTGTGPTPITLADGTTVTADSPQLAEVIKDIQAGTNPVDAYRKHDIVLPPTTSPPAAPLDPSNLQAGSYATYTNGDIVVALGPQKAWVDGHIQPISATAKPGFLGWQNPPTPVQQTTSPTPVAPLTPATSPAR
jgi:hypothetical protein